MFVIWFFLRVILFLFGLGFLLGLYVGVAMYGEIKEELSLPGKALMFFLLIAYVILAALSLHGATTLHCS